MVRLGADVEQLDALARVFDGESNRLDALAASLTATVRSVQWIGPDADRFRAEWVGTHRPRVQSIADVLRTQGRALIDQARQQRQASDGAGVGETFCPYGPGSPSRPPSTTPILRADRVTRSELISVDGQLGISAAQFRVHGSYLVEYLANGEIRVTEILGYEEGASADAGIRADLDLGSTEIRLGGMAGASVLGGLQQGRTWEIPPGELDELLVAVGIERFGVPEIALDGADVATDVLDEVTPDDINISIPGVGSIGADNPIDEANDLIDHYLDYELPDPVREGVDLTASADAYADLAPLGLSGSGRLEAGANIEIGAFRESDGDIGVRYAQAGHVSGEIDTPFVELSDLFDHPNGSLVGSQAVEFIFDDQGRPAELSIEQIYGTGENQTLLTATVELDSGQLRDDAIAIRDAITDPSPANLDRVLQIDIGSWADNIEFTEADLSVGGEDYGAGAGVGAIPGLVEGTADLRIDHVTVDYDYRGDNR
jgi:uncharacterized protein YukE